MSRTAPRSHTRYRSHPAKPTTIENAADAAQIRTAPRNGIWAGTEAQAPRAKIPKNGPLGLSRTLSENSEPTPARSASVTTKPQD